MEEICSQAHCLPPACGAGLKSAGGVPAPGHRGACPLPGEPGGRAKLSEQGSHSKASFPDPSVDQAVRQGQPSHRSGPVTPAVSPSAQCRAVPTPHLVYLMARPSFGGVHVSCLVWRGEAACGTCVPALWQVSSLARESRTRHTCSSRRQRPKPRMMAFLHRGAALGLSSECDPAAHSGPSACPLIARAAPAPGPLHELCLQLPGSCPAVHQAAQWEMQPQMWPLCLLELSNPFLLFLFKIVASYTYKIYHLNYF